MEKLLIALAVLVGVGLLTLGGRKFSKVIDEADRAESESEF